MPQAAICIIAYCCEQYHHLTYCYKHDQVSIYYSCYIYADTSISQKTGPVANVMLPVSRVDQPAVSLPLTSATESRPSLSEKNISIEVYPRVLKQGDSFFVKVIGGDLDDNLRGRFLEHNLIFTSIDDVTGRLALFGIDAKEKTGEYKLFLSHAGNDNEYDIKIVNGEFPETKLVVTEELKDQGYTPGKIVQSIGQDENVKLREVMKTITTSAFFSGSFVYPLNKIKVEGSFGNIRREGDSAFQHLGVDLEAKIGTPVLAINDGKVVFSDDLRTYGKTLVIDHGLGIYSLYLHLSESDAAIGDVVSRGAAIALSGNSGYSIDPHLHVSLKINGASVDPLKFIQLSKKW